MDIGDIGKVASRKRLNVEAEKLREKVSRETAKIIKLKVAQDTAYWDLKEKLQQVEGNHERLQQNMVEVQMQHEAISGQYQDELRLRPETLNKMSSTREICDVLEEYSERLKETLARCQGDQAALCDAYQRSGRLVQGIKQDQLRREEGNKQLVERLEDKGRPLLVVPAVAYNRLVSLIVKLTSEHQSQLLQYFTAAKQQGDAELADARQQLAAACKQKDELLVAVNELRRKADVDQLDINKKDEAIATLQKDMKQLLHEFNLQAGEMKNTLLKQDKDLKEASESNEALKKALTNQEAFTKSICDQNSQLQEKISALEEENISTNNTIKDLETKLQVAITTNEEFKKDNALLVEKQEELELAVANGDKLLKNSENEILDLKQQLLTLEGEKVDLTSELMVCKEECSGKSARVQELEQLVENLQTKVTELEKELEESMQAAARQAAEQSASSAALNRELDSKARTIAQLMTELKDAADAAARTDAQLARLRADADAERRAAAERDRAAQQAREKLELAVRTKDDEISKQINIILEIRSEKERLQEKIQSMQNTIDNIQKELTGRVAPAASRQPPEQDDNAVMCAPSKELSQSPKLPIKFAVPRSEPKQLDLFSLFSDGSMDGDTLDPTEVNRRFEALSRGERVAPLPLGGLKRRAGVPAAHAALKHKPAANDDPISLSQVKSSIKKEKGFFKTKRAEAKNKKF